MRGFQSDPIKEYATLTELAVVIRQWQDGENAAKHAARRAIDDGCRAQVVADALGMSRPTLYRWMSDFH